MNHSVRRLTRCAVLTALALAISVCEGLVPLTVLIPMPGLRLGLANLVTVYALCILSSREALAILVSRCLLSALVGGNLTALAFSLTGGVFALLTMWALLHFRGFSLFGVCIAGAAAHNAGQILAAIAVLGSPRHRRVPGPAPARQRGHGRRHRGRLHPAGPPGTAARRQEILTDS